MSRYFLGITGASGHRYAERLARALLAGGHELDLAVTDAGAKVLRHELGVAVDARGRFEAQELERWLGPAAAGRVRSFASDQVEAPAASGTSGTRAVLVCPCSMGTLARVAAGFSSNLVERAADVALKERRPLVLVPRETPLSELHLENLLRLARLGAIVLPAMPGFYHAPRTIDDLVDHVVGKVLDALGLEHREGARWTGELSGDPGCEPPGGR
ncbi:MAG: UbiX family flavin prenyltransferase [Planctomycetes bacterium]|nr:UbiX family flavin prenyltransferase [Planctomycetota bacterium]